MVLDTQQIQRSIVFTLQALTLSNQLSHFTADLGTVILLERNLRRKKAGFNDTAYIIDHCWQPVMDVFGEESRF